MNYINIKLLFFLLIFILYFGCHNNHKNRTNASSDVTYEQKKTDQPQNINKATLSDKTKQPSLVTIEPVGYESIPSNPSQKAIKANNEGYKLYTKGNYEEALKHFSEAISIAPEYGLARYNEACIYARLSSFDKAASELEHLLVRDLPTYRKRIEKDPDLEIFLKSPYGEKIQKRIAELEKSYLYAAQKGVPSVTWQQKERDYPEMRNILYIRAGIYMHEWKRFVPLVPELQKTFSALYDPHLNKVLIVQGEGDFDGIAHMNFLKLKLYEPVTGKELHFHEPVTEKELHYYNYLDCGLTGDTYLALTEKNIQIKTDYCEGRGLQPNFWYDITSSGFQKITDSSKIGNQVLSISSEGSMLETKGPEGYSIKNNELIIPSGEKIQLGKGHGRTKRHSILTTSDKKYAVIVSVFSECDCSDTEKFLLRHYIDLVDLENHTVKRLSEDNTNATAYIDNNDVLYIQFDKVLRRYENIQDNNYEEITPGILLTPPIEAPECCSA